MLREETTQTIDGLLRCSRYAFGPNRLHYCGPAANRELLDYIRHGASDPGLEKILSAFATLYPYLRLISRANNIQNPFDTRVVEAYWIGNTLLDHVGRQALYRALLEEHHIKEKIGARSLDQLTEKIKKRALPHHSFHVMNIWRRTGNLGQAYTLQSMDACRVSWGKVLRVEGPAITVETEPLIEEHGNLALGTPITKKIARSLESDYEIEQLKIGSLVSIHWGVPCEVITPPELTRLKYYTLQSIRLANEIR